MFRCLVNFFSVWSFVTRVLFSRGEKIFVALELILTAIAIVLFGLDVFAGALASASLGAIGFVVVVWSVLKSYQRARGATIKIDGATKELIGQLHLSKAYLESGYEILSHPSDRSKKVARSRKVDEYLRANDVAMTENPRYSQLLDDKFATNPKMYELALLCQHRESCRSHPPRSFFNEQKTCLATDMLVGTDSVEVFRGSYFRSFLTNEMSVREIESVGSSPARIFGGRDLYPCSLGPDNDYVLKPIEDSRMGNHIGISTLGYTKDGKIVIWQQSNRAQQNPGNLVPVGSGSCDWQDWERVGRPANLKSLVSGAMQRELKEESLGDLEKFSKVTLDTRLLGFFRWLNRGGKPEFVGLTKIDVKANRLAANGVEVGKPDYAITEYPASTLEELKGTIEELLNKEHISVPLWMSLFCLREAIDAGDADIIAFLGIS